MSVLRMGSRILSRTTPAGLILAGAALAMSMPMVRRQVKATTAFALRGLLSLVEEDDEPDMADMDDENLPSRRERWRQFRDRSKESARRAAVGTATTMMSASDKAKELYEDMTHEIRNIIGEAKSSRLRATADDVELKTTSDLDPIPDDFEERRHDRGL